MKTSEFAVELCKREEKDILGKLLCYVSNQKSNRSFEDVLQNGVLKNSANFSEKLCVGVSFK